MSQSNHPQQTNGDTFADNVSGIGNAVGAGAQSNVTINNTQLPSLPINLRSLVQPLIDNYLKEPFGGRDAELAMLDAFLDDPECAYGLLVAPTGLGKTALLIRWLSHLQERRPSYHVIFAPISIRYQTATEQTTYGILAHSLAEVHNDLENFRQYDKSQGLRALVIDYLRRPLPAGRQLLLVIDAIDEATGWELGPLCANQPQTGLKIIISARQRADKTRDDWRFHLGWHNYPASQLDLYQLGRPAVHQLLKQNEYPLASDSAFVDQFYRVSQGDPLTCNLLLKALISGEIEPDSLTNRPLGLEAFLKNWVETLSKRSKESVAIQELLALCAAANGPLTTSDLKALAPQIFKKHADITHAVRDNEVARFIITVGKHTYVFSHQRLREVFLEEIYPEEDGQELQQRLIDYGNAWYADRSQPLSDYLRHFWIAHLYAAGDWQRIQQVLTEIVPSSDGKYCLQPWQAARFAVEGSDTAYLADLDLLWRWAEQQNDFSLAMRCALIDASLRSRSSDLRPELLVQLVQVGTPDGVWSPAVALEQIAHMPEPINQVVCLKALLKAGIILPWQRTLEIASSIIDQNYRAEALSSLASYLPPNLLTKALQTAQTISNKDYRARALSALVPHFSLNQQEDVLAETFRAAQTIKNEQYRILALTNLVPHLPSKLLAQALQAVEAINDESIRVEALSTFVPHLTPNLMAEALQIARALSGEYWRADALSVLVPYLPPYLLTEAFQLAYVIENQQHRAVAIAAIAPYLPANLLSEALQIVQAISDKMSRVMALTTLGSLLPAGQRDDVLAEALQIAYVMDDERSRAQALTALGPLLPSDQQKNALTAALQAARSISIDSSRAQALTVLAPLLPSDQQKNVLIEALQAVRSIYDKRSRSRALTALSPYLPPNLLSEALQLAYDISDKKSRIYAVTTLASLIDIEQKKAALAEALQSARIISDERSRAEVLTALAPHLPPDLLAEALQSARVTFNEYSRAEAASHFNTSKPPKRLAKALQSARSISNEWRRAEALSALALYLPPDQQADVLTEALQAAQAISFDASRAQALNALAPMLDIEPSLNQQFLSTLRICAGRGRPRALSDLAALTPWIIAIAERAQQPNAINEFADAIIETARCWP
jgi:uncharacterized protein YeeX (DUF496 family)